MLSGSCACGYIRYTATTGPNPLVNCHCSTCRKLAGAPYQTFAWFPTSAIQWQTQPTVWRSSEIATRSFCPRCGSCLCMREDRDPESIAMLAGTLDDPGPGKIPSPSVHIFLQEKASWFELPEDEIEKYEGPRRRET